MTLKNLTLSKLSQPFYHQQSSHYIQYIQDRKTSLNKKCQEDLGLAEKGCQWLPFRGDSGEAHLPECICVEVFISHLDHLQGSIQESKTANSLNDYSSNALCFVGFRALLSCFLSGVTLALSSGWQDPQASERSPAGSDRHRLRLRRDRPFH